MTIALSAVEGALNRLALLNGNLFKPFKTFQPFKSWKADSRILSPFDQLADRVFQQPAGQIKSCLSKWATAHVSSSRVPHHLICGVGAHLTLSRVKSMINFPGIGTDANG